MSDERHRSNPSVEEIFLAALEKPPGTERNTYLDDACGQNPEARRKVEELLASYQEDDFLERSALAVDPPEDTLAEIREQPGMLVGHYKLVEQIGEGGFGTVFMAEQTEPIRRKVALKIIKAGMDTKQVIARFEAERQALALMDHPNIAKVLGAGATEHGRPYFVMDLVRGVPITKFCDLHRLTVKERLNLFIPVCRAIQHAHQKGIIHRDIKPSNVIVTFDGEVPRPIVIDFGVAKAINQRLTERTLLTNLTQMLGTPAYMSPEQAEMSGWDIDTRSDIYSLGVLLYELLTGQTPFDTQQLLQAGLDEMRRMIRENEPPRPSTRLTTLNDVEREKVAKHQRSVPAKLSGQLTGDLDWIIMKALEKDRTRRYDTAGRLALDIERHLKHEPVEAVAPSVGYRFCKYARRNRVAVAVGITLVLATVLSAWEAFRAESAQKVADENLKMALASQKAAVTSRSMSEDLLSFIMNDLYDQLNDLRQLSLLEPVVTKANEYFKNLDTNQITLDSEFIRSVALSMQARLAINRGDLIAGSSNYLEVLTIRKELVKADPNNELWQRMLAGTYYSLSVNARRFGRWSDRFRWLDRSIEILEKVVNPISSDAEARTQLAQVYRRRGGQFTRSRPLYYLNQAQQLFRKLLEEDPANDTTAQRLAIIIKMRGHYWRTRGEHQKAFERFQEALQVVLSRTNLSSSIGLKNERAWIHYHLAEEYQNPESKNDRHKALQHLTTSLKIFDEIVPLYETDYAYPGQAIHKGLARVNNRLGEFHLQDSPSLAVDCFSRAWDYYLRLRKGSPLDKYAKDKEVDYYDDLSAACRAMLVEATATNDLQLTHTNWSTLRTNAEKRFSFLADITSFKALADAYSALGQQRMVDNDLESAVNYSWAALYLRQQLQGLSNNRAFIDRDSVHDYERLTRAVTNAKTDTRQPTLIPQGSVWKYFDKGVPPGSVWKRPGFGDTGWDSGPAPLGYGDDWIRTPIKFGADPMNRHITTYFRRAFTVEQPESIQMLGLQLLRNDGVLVYVNGIEILRDHLPATNIAHFTTAVRRVSDIGLPGGSNYLHYLIEPKGLLERTNVFAVELHRVLWATSDLSFDLELSGFDVPLDALLNRFDSASVKAFLEEKGVPLPEDLLNGESKVTSATVQALDQ